MAVTVTQRKSELSSATTSARTLTFASTPVAGVSVIVAICSNVAVSSVTDNKGNTYVRDTANSATPGSFLSIWRCTGIVSPSATFTVTAYLANTGIRRLLWSITELNTAVVFDKQITRNGTSSTVSTTALVGQKLNTSQYGVALFNAGTIPAGVIPPVEWNMVQLSTASPLVGGLFDRPSWTPTSVASVSWGLSGVRPWAAGLANYLEAVVADFTGTPTTGTSPLSVDFSFTGTGSPSTLHWFFGDGEEDSTGATDPTHEYAAAGSYTVTLVVANANGSSSRTRQDYIVVDSAPPTGAEPTPPGIPNVPFPSPFNPFGPLRNVPGTTAFLIAHAPPPRFEPPPATTTAPSQALLVPLTLRESMARLERASRNTALMLNALLRAKYLHRVDDETFAIRGGGFSSEREPTADDDATIGALAGVPWCVGTDPDTAQVFVCADATVGAAVWVELFLNEGAGGVGGLTGSYP